MYYLLLVAAWILGQAFYTSITVWRLQKDLPIDYMPALKAYCKKELGGYIVSGMLMVIIVFLLPELLNLNMSKADILSKDKRSYAEMVQLYFRSACTLLGMFSLHVSYALYKGGKKAVHEAAMKKGIDIDDIDKNKN